MDEQYIQYLIGLGFDREVAEKLAKGRAAEKVLPEEDFLKVCACIENDRVEPLKPLVEKYGFEELLERFAKTADN